MSQQLINLSPDLKKLRDEGYEIEIRNGYLIIHSVPYVGSDCKIRYGKLVSSLTLNNNKTVKPDDHVILFSGEYPCNKDGTEISAIRHSQKNQTIYEGVTVNYSFSNKPPNGYATYYEKVTQYVEIISSQAKAIDSSVTAKTFKVVSDIDNESRFKYIDTNSSRANISQLNSKFDDQKIGIIGLGGTGSYVLDFIAKTTVKEIWLFDGDVFLQHNAFRSPGAPSIENLEKQSQKVEYFSSIYSNMHNGIKTHAFNITEGNVELLRDLSFVFICVDSNKARGKIILKLLEFGIAFIDVGLGVNTTDDALIGTVRVTVGTSSKNNHIADRIGSLNVDDNEYSSNIQIADLNALNAVMAVIKWKKLRGFYQDFKAEHHSTYTINTSQLLNEDLKA